MFGAFCEAARNGHGLHHGCVAPQIVFAGMPNFSSRDEVRFVEVFEMDSNNGIVQHAGVSSTNRLHYLRNRLSHHVKIAGAEQSDISIWLDGRRLIEFWGQRKSQVKDVAPT